MRETEILEEQQSPQGVFVCDHAGLVINKLSQVWTLGVHNTWSWATVIGQLTKPAPNTHGKIVEQDFLELCYSSGWVSTVLADLTWFRYFSADADDASRASNLEEAKAAQGRPRAVKTPKPLWVDR